MNIEKQFPIEFQVLKDHGRLVDDWSNVYDHCKKEAEVALVLSSFLGLDFKDMHSLVKAAILHDWFKRKERELAKENPTSYGDSEKLSEKGLLELGYDPYVVSIAHSVGSMSLPWIVECRDILKMAMHWIDDCVHGDQFIGYKARIDELEKAPRYKEWNQTGIPIYGMTLFEKQREVAGIIEERLTAYCPNLWYENNEHSLINNIQKFI